jgi:hypothetical protein
VDTNTSGQGHRRTITGIQTDRDSDTDGDVEGRDTDGQAEGRDTDRQEPGKGHRRTERDTVKQTDRDRDKGGQGQEQRQSEPCTFSVDLC